MEPQESVTATDVLSLVVGFAAFFVALLTLYLSNLERPQIVMALSPDDPPQLSSDAWVTQEEGRFPIGLTTPHSTCRVQHRSGEWCPHADNDDEDQ
jgi:hypothetical protein